VPSDVVTGYVTRGGTGPCYGLVDDDGVEYALHSTAGLQLDEGTYIRARIARHAPETSCGPGRNVAALEITTL
jgi:hypothetical protein